MADNQKFTQSIVLILLTQKMADNDKFIYSIVRVTNCIQNKHSPEN